MKLARDIANSSHIHWKSTSPFRVGEVGFARVGFADIPCVTVPVYCKPDDNLTPIVRQAVYSFINARFKGTGYDSDCLEFTPTVGCGSRRMKFVDENRDSPTVGKNKFGVCMRFRFEITRKDAIAVFEALPRHYA